MRINRNFRTQRKKVKIKKKETIQTNNTYIRRTTGSEKNSRWSHWRRRINFWEKRCRIWSSDSEKCSCKSTDWSSCPKKSSIPSNNWTISLCRRWLWSWRRTNKTLRNSSPNMTHPILFMASLWILIRNMDSGAVRKCKSWTITTMRLWRPCWEIASDTFVWCVCMPNRASKFRRFHSMRRSMPRSLTSCSLMRIRWNDWNIFKSICIPWY